MSITAFARRSAYAAVPRAALSAALAFSASTPAAAQRALFTEETAGAFWAPTHECAEGGPVQGTLLVQTTRVFESPDRDDANPTVRVQFLAVCPDGRSFSWAAGSVPATLTSTEDLRSVTASGAGVARDNLGGTHQISFDVAWTGVGSLEVDRPAPGSMRKEREATATGQVIFDGEAIVDGSNNHPTREAPFVRVDTER
ncbi:hypothetical protein [Actinopolymorpha pittospori]|uniref:Secreted protein n=1 Tax=Actinopolymorpha pittospori TaxID=648752 RepID=A0A927MTB1_9ACTN|nr:hypothetical protein [Actinopolymorpha pittospori]MBE1606530.1 hypothetical protein [Actinopolymorpha pittospori]